MRKGNAEYFIIYAAVIAAVILISFFDIEFFKNEDFIRVFRNITYSAPVLFIIAAFLAFRIAEPRVVLISMVFLVLSFSEPFLQLLDRMDAGANGESALLRLYSLENLVHALQRLPLLLSYALALVFVLPGRIGRLTMTWLKILLVLIPFAIVFFPGSPGQRLWTEYLPENLFTPLPVFVAALLPAVLVFFYRNRRTIIFSAAFSSVLILSVLPLLMQLNSFLSDVCRIFSGIILLHALYRVYWDNSYLDELTGLFNRRAFDEKMRKLRKGYALSMVDVDHFKNFNDTYGHDEGDNVLRLVSSILFKHFKRSVFRYGGEEFCVVFTRTTVLSAREKMDAARKEIEEHMFSIRNKAKNRKKSGRKKPKKNVKRVKLTVSAGISIPSDTVRDAEEVLKNADKALYRAKENGRNRVEVLKRR